MIEQAGYIVHDNEGIIHGCGETADAAWSDMENTMRHANIEIVPDDADTSDHWGNWARESCYKIAPATAALLRRVYDDGGACSWGTAGGVACTVEEELFG